MKKADIIQKLNAFPYEKSQYRVITGGAMVMHGIRENTHDIDLGCTAEMADRLESGGFLCGVSADGNRRFAYGGDIEIFENWLCGTSVFIEGIPVISVKGLLGMKKSLGREKDKKDVLLITEHLKSEAQKIIGKNVRGVIDRPAGSRHPVYGDMVYPVNYGYVEGVYAGDGEEQDVYVLGADGPIETFEGKVIAVCCRLDDAEDKWIVSADGRDYTDEEIMRQIGFQERYFDSELIR